MRSDFPIFPFLITWLIALSFLIVFFVVRHESGDKPVEFTFYFNLSVPTSLINNSQLQGKEEEITTTTTPTTTTTTTTTEISSSSSSSPSPTNYSEIIKEKKILPTNLTNFHPDLCTEEMKKEEEIDWEKLFLIRSPSSSNTKENKSLLWCKVPKSGSTTLTKLFLLLANAGENATSSNVEMHKSIDTFYKKLSSPEISEGQREEIISGDGGTNDTLRFLVARHPLERILSAYRDKLENYEKDFNETGGQFYDQFGVFMIKNNVTGKKEPTFLEFVEYLLETDVKKYNPHWMPISRLCSPCRVQYDLVVKMETFEKDISPILDFVKVDKKDVQVEKLQTTGSSDKELLEKYYKDIDNDKIQKLYEKFKDDFTLFGFSLQEYLH